MAPDRHLLERELAELRQREAGYRERLATARERAAHLGRYLGHIRDAMRDRAPADTAELLREVATLSGVALGTRRTSVWQVEPNALECRLLLVDGDDAEPEASLPLSACAAYVEALETEDAVAVSNVRTDPRTVGLRAYIDARGIGAMLDIPLMAPGRLTGVVCHEHVGGSREWTPQEVDFAATVAALVAVTLEAEARIAAERAAASTAARYQHLVESLPVTLYAFDARSRKLTYISPSAAALTGVDGWDLDTATERWLAFIPEAFRSAPRDRLAGTDADALPPEIVYPIDLPSGRKWIRDTIGIVRDPVGRPLAIQGMFADITEQHTAEVARRAADERYQELLTSVELLVLVVDRDGAVEMVNDAFVDAIGVPRDALVGARWTDVAVPEADRPAAAAAFERAMGTGVVSRRTERRLPCKGGPDRFVAWTHLVRTDGNGLPTGIASLGLDITERAEAEAAELRGRKLESLGRLATAVARDFANMVKVIELALPDLAGDGDERAAAIADVREVCRTATDLTATLLDYGRMSEGPVTSTPADALVRSIAPMLDRMVPRDVVVDVSTHAGDATVSVDAARIRQVLLHLAGNAFDATSGYGRSVRVSSESVELAAPDARTVGLPAGGPFVVFTVADDGRGFGPAVLSRLFEPFFSTKEAGYGSGLGLAVCDAIVRRAGGAISVQSREGRGSDFRVYLPRAVADRSPRS